VADFPDQSSGGGRVDGLLHGPDGDWSRAVRAGLAVAPTGASSTSTSPSIRRRPGPLSKSSKRFLTTRRHNGCWEIETASTAMPSVAASRIWGSRRSSAVRRAHGKPVRRTSGSDQFVASAWTTSSCSARPICADCSPRTWRITTEVGRISD